MVQFGQRQQECDQVCSSVWSMNIPNIHNSNNGDILSLTLFFVGLMLSVYMGSVVGPTSKREGTYCYEPGKYWATGARHKDLELIGTRSKASGAANLRAAELEAAGAGAEELDVADLDAEDLEAAEAGAKEREVANLGAEELGAADLGAKRSTGREDAESRPLKVAPGSLKDPLKTVFLLSSPPQPRQAPNILEKKDSLKTHDKVLTY